MGLCSFLEVPTGPYVSFGSLAVHKYVLANFIQSSNSVMH